MLVVCCQKKLGQVLVNYVLIVERGHKMGKKIWLTGKAYLESDVWKCPDSPTGAHHWKELNHLEASSGLFYCKWCFDVKQFPTSWSYSQWLGTKSTEAVEF